MLSQGWLRHYYKKYYAIGFIAGFGNNATKNPTMCIYDLPILISKPSQHIRSPQLARRSTHDPLCFVSEAQGEQAVKLLQLIAGDVETNPGPMAVSFYRTQVSLGSGLWVPVSVPTYNTFG